VSSIIAILGILLTIFFVIGTHESAHFLMARLLHVKVLRFSIGFGKTLWRHYDRHGTEYVVALLPLGGYVKMLDESEDTVPPDQLPFAFNRQPFYKKFLIVLAGPCANILSAFILYWIIFSIGFTTIKPIIGSITPHSIAAEAGLAPQQEIMQVDHQPVSSWTAILFRIMLHLGDQDTISVQTLHQNQSRIHTLHLTSWHVDDLNPDPLASLGIKPYVPSSFHWPATLLSHIQYPPLPAAYHAWREIVDFTVFNFLLFGKIITGKLSLHSLGGPITIFETAGDALNSGVLAFLGFLAFLSVSIGIINLLPIPGLDGGHLFIQVIEFIIQRAIPERVVLLLFRLGFILILFVLVQALMNDILRLY